MKRIVVTTGCMVALLAICAQGQTETKKEYENRFRLMFDYAVRVNEYVRARLGDKGLASYAHAMAEQNATQAERMTPPTQFSMIHPHFLLVLENIERSFFFVSKNNLQRYRHHQNVMRKELRILEALAEREHIDLYLWGNRY